jgi:type I restriction enzyme S subunit
MGKWIKTTLGELADVYDGPHATPKKASSGPWFLSISSLDGGRLNLDESAHLSEEDFLKWTRRVIPKSGDVLFSYETRLGEAAPMPSNVRACLGRRMGLLRPKTNRVDARFLLYAYLAPAFQKVIKERKVHGATVDRIPLVDLPSWPISVPDLPGQLAIAAILGVLDDKIAVNDHIAATCDKLARSLILRATDGAVTTKLSNLAEITMGTSPPGHTYNDEAVGLPFYQGTRDFGSRYPSRRVWCSAPERVAPAEAILVSVRAPVGRLNIAMQQCCIGRGLASLVTKHSSPSVLFHTLASVPGIWVPFESEGTVFGSITRSQIEKLAVPLVDGSKLEASLASLDRQVKLSVKESETLIQLRDTLLPKLMSGELRVRDVEKLAEDAT